MRYKGPVPVLILCLNRATWGEAYFARALADDLGRSALVLAHETSATLFRGVPQRLYRDATGPRVRALLHEVRPSAVVLADLFTTSGTMAEFGEDPADLLRLDVPLVGVDTWDLAVTGYRMDVFDGGRYDIPRWIGRVSRRLRPAPFLRPGGRGSCRWLKPARPVRLLRDGRKTILFCTSRWQHQVAGSASVLARLLDLVRRAGPELDVVHVGPEPLKAGRRYSWRPPSPPEDFRRLLRDVDLLLTANPASTVVGEAVAAGLPVLAVSGGTPAPWTVWPLGLSRFTAPLWERNPLMKALQRTDLDDEAGLLDRLRRILYDFRERERLRAGQISYGRRLKELPTAGALLRRWIR